MELCYPGVWGGALPQLFQGGLSVGANRPLSTVRIYYLTSAGNKGHFSVRVPDKAPEQHLSPLSKDESTA